MLCCDHAALERKLTKSQNEPPVNDREARWVERLLPFPFTFQLIKGVNNVVADALSRAPHLCTMTVVRSLLGAMIELLQQAASLDPDYQTRLLDITAHPDNQTLRAETGLIRETTGQIWVPNNRSLRTFLITDAHDSPLSGHFAADRTLHLLSLRWRWKEMRQDVEEYIASCVTCQRAKHRNTKAPGQLHPILTLSL